MKLVVKKLKKSFDKKEVLKDINFNFEKGKIYGLLGRNGAGKTTFFNCLNEDIEVDAGEFYIEESIIGIGLALLLFLSGGTDNVLNYVVLIVSIISMSIFFCVHYLVMYYLLQPYNVNTEIKSSTYKAVQAITYFACYYMIQIQLPTLSFGIAMIVFCIAYCLISLILAYKYAPKTFKLRL